MPKYKEYYNMMLKNNTELFEKFGEIHDQYVMQPDKWRDEFNEVGAKVVEQVRDWELKLCRASEGGQYGKYAANLSEKFWGEARKNYPKIDFVGTK
jgi:hypothetical protein